MPSVEASEASLHSGVWVAIVNRDAAVSAPGASCEGAEEFAGPNGAVMKNAAAVCAIFVLPFGARSGESG